MATVSHEAYLTEESEIANVSGLICCEKKATPKNGRKAKRSRFCSPSIAAKSLFTAKAEQTYFAIRGGKVKRVDAASVVEAASVCGSKLHFAAKLRICPPRHAGIRDMMPSRCAS
ncbi:hypothetical protein DPMN_161101 [Dreissena polymorpha]|uniref:Uncharacterized protein n=1 Tax=Dreissena polymorpha TaxID=45954 RepID=A0A9D4EP39_DREPO|nr:hypothetical protein DPMN_161101 [Dreissena polymorpha]